MEVTQLSLYSIDRIVNVNMYHSLLSPDFTLQREWTTEDEERRLWERFDIKTYMRVVLERAVIELKALLSRLPSDLCARYIEGSAEIISPPDYSYGGDFLRCRLELKSNMTHSQMQAYLDAFFSEDWNAEFGPDYSICEYLSDNYSLEDFQLGTGLTDEGDDSRV